jgi:hypothetical protein
MLNTNPHNLFTITLLVLLTLGLSISLQSLLAAWISPSLNPPLGNTDAPLTQGYTNEAKLGGLAIGGDLKVGVNDIYSDSVSHQIGIGTINPSAKLYIYQDDSTGPAMSLYREETAVNNGESVLDIYQTDSDDNNASAIYAEQWSNANIMELYKNDTTPRFTITSEGYTGINDTTPNGDLDVQSSLAQDAKLRISNTNGGNYDPILNFDLSDSNATFSMGVDDSDSDKFKISSGGTLGTTDRLIIQTNGYVGIGSTTPGRSLDVGGAILASGDICTTNGGTKCLSTTGNSGTVGAATLAGQLPYYAAAGNVLTATSSIFLSTAGNVGIGMTSPTYKLQINGGIAYGNSYTRTETRTDAGLRGDAGAQSGFFQNDGSTVTNYPAGANSWWHLIDARHSNPANNYALQIAGSFFDQELYFRKTNDNAAIAWNRFIYQNSAGNVGIGTANPGLKLDVIGGHGDTRLRLYSTGDGGSNDAYLNLWASEPGLTYTGVGIGNNISGNSYYGRANTSRGASYIRLLDNGINFNTINSAGVDVNTMAIVGGNVGIGINPGAKLDVNGSSLFRDYVYSGKIINGETVNGGFLGSGVEIGASGEINAGDFWSGKRVMGRLAYRDFSGINYGVYGSYYANGDYLTNQSGFGLYIQGQSRIVGDRLTVGPFTSLPATLQEGYIEASGAMAGLLLVNRSLATWPASPVPGNRFVWYDSSNGLYLWTDVNNNIAVIDSTGNYSKLSDIRYKKNIIQINDALKKVTMLRGVSYNFINGNNDTNKKQLGFIAQEVEPILPEAVSTDESGVKSLSYDSFIPVVAEAIKEQQKQIEDMDEIINELKKDNQDLHDQIGELQSILKKATK